MPWEATPLRSRAPAGLNLIVAADHLACCAGVEMMAKQ
jgi:hypothetical protein